MKNKLHLFFGSFFALLAGFAAMIAAFKVAAGVLGLDAVLNVASNCGPESAAGGVGAGAGSAACGNEEYGSNVVADADSAINPMPSHNSAGRSNYETYKRYRDQQQNRTERQQSEGEQQKDRSQINADSLKQGPAQPVPQIEFPEPEVKEQGSTDVV